MPLKGKQTSKNFSETYLNNSFLLVSNFVAKML